MVCIIQTSPPRTGSTVLSNVLYGLFYGVDSYICFEPRACALEEEPVKLVKSHDMNIEKWKILNPGCIVVTSYRRDELMTTDVPFGDNIFAFDYNVLHTEKNTVENICKYIANALSENVPIAEMSVGSAIQRLNDMNNTYSEISHFSFDIFHMKYHIHGSHKDPKITRRTITMPS